MQAVLSNFDYLTLYSSHFNRTHFLNPDFHPDEWDPSKEYIVPNPRGKSKFGR